MKRPDPGHEDRKDLRDSLLVGFLPKREKSESFSKKIEKDSLTPPG